MGDMAMSTRPGKAANVNAAPRPPQESIPPRAVIAELEKHILVDGLKLVFDLENSKGSRFVDAATGREFIDFYSFFASQPVGHNHPYFDRPEVRAGLAASAKVKVANSDVYTVQFATLVQTFARVMGFPPLDRYFFIEVGALAGENALKAGMGWKQRENLAASRRE